MPWQGTVNIFSVYKAYAPAFTALNNPDLSTSQTQHLSQHKPKSSNLPILNIRIDIHLNDSSTDPSSLRNYSCA